MSKTVGALVVSGALMFACAKASLAQEAFGAAPDADVKGPLTSDTAVDLTATPRFWYMFSTFANGKALPGQKSLTSTASVSFPMAGAAISARLGVLPDTTFVFSALDGPGTEKLDQLSVGDTQIGHIRENINRQDLEFLAQTAIYGSNWSWIVGARYEHETTPESSVSFGIVPVATKLTGPSLNDYTVKAGMTGAIPISASPDVRMFGNILALGGVELQNGSVTNGLVGTDLAVGVQYLFASDISLDARYRAIVSFLVDAPPGNGSHYVSHGPMLGLNIHF
ncbi:MAG: hypothetical protein JO001_01525 [Alphaproteobacteria bacterium]|nr:hypothetical protein [Alphaproteobacteria bacterium]